MNKKIKALFALLITSSLIFCFFGRETLAAVSVPRIAGDNRYLTAIEISKAGWTTSANAVLVTGEDFPDALCAAPLAKQLNAPILLSEKLSLRSDVENELNRLRATNVYIIGGEDVISKSIKDKLQLKNIKCTRIFGNNRYDTSVEVAKYLKANFPISTGVAVATGDDYPDALSMAPVAGTLGMPILLVPKLSFPSNMQTYIKGNGVTKAYVIGGDDVVSNSIANSIPCTWERVYGSNRYTTNIAVLNRFAGSLNFGTSYLATGEDFPDALAGSALAVKTQSPVILTSPIPDDATKSFISSRYSSMYIVKALGGDDVVPSSTYLNLTTVLISIDDINSSVYMGQGFALPTTVTGKMSNGTTKQYPVAWNPSSVDTSIGGVYTFSGTVSGWSKSVTLTLNVNVVKHPIMGSSQVTAEQMAAFLLKYNPNAYSTINPDPAKPQLSVIDFCRIYLDEGAKEGIRGDVAFTQSIHETGWFRFGGQVLPQQYNYAGIGATNDSPIGKGAWFADQREGIRAQIQHLKGYATTAPLNQACVDPRYSILVQNGLLGVAPNWEDLAGRWAYPGYDSAVYASLTDALNHSDSYGQSIYELYGDLKSYPN